MTVIAWDGKTLAADKRAVNGSLIRTTTKIFKVYDLIVAVAGKFDYGLQMVDWVQKGRNPEAYPKCQSDTENWVSLLVVENGKLLVYEMTPFPLIFEDAHYATGFGRDFAMAAMHVGYDAPGAVRIACELSADCGNGVDFFTT